MGRKKISITRIESPTVRQVTYSKRKAGIVKKASELSILCGVDVGVIIFSPAGRVTTYPPDERLEDIFLRYFRVAPRLNGGPFPNEETLVQELKYLKPLRELVGRISMREARLKELNTIKEEEIETRKKLKMFVPEVEDIKTVAQAEHSEMIVGNALQRLKNIREGLVKRKNSLQPAETIKASSKDIEGTEIASAGSAGSKQVSLRNESENEGNAETTNGTSATAEKDNVATDQEAI